MFATILDILIPSREKRIAELKETQNLLSNKYPTYERKSTIFWNGVTAPSELLNDINFLSDVINGVKKRDDIRRGLCFGLRSRMANREFLKDYKYWSGNLGHVIKLNFLSGDSWSQYFSERKGCYKEDQIAYYQARQELAVHWRKILIPIYQDVLSYKGSR